MRDHQRPKILVPGLDAQQDGRGRHHGQAQGEEERPVDPPRARPVHARRIDHVLRDLSEELVEQKDVKGARDPGQDLGRERIAEADPVYNHQQRQHDGFLRHDVEGDQQAEDEPQTQASTKAAAELTKMPNPTVIARMNNEFRR